MADKPATPRRRGRLWLRGVLFLAVAGAGLAAWVAFLPVPLGWIARPIVSRVLSGSGMPEVQFEGATFRWHFGAPELSLQVRGLKTYIATQPLADLPSVTVKVVKQGLTGGRVLATEVLLDRPFLTLDQTGSGALATLTTPAAPRPASATPAAAAPGGIDLADFDAYLPAAGQQTRLRIEGLSARVHLRAGERVLYFAPIEVVLNRGAAAQLELAADVPLSATNRPPRISFRATAAPATGAVDFTVALPAFAMADLPDLPGAPNPLPLQGQVTVEATGRFDLKTLALQNIAGGVVLKDATLTVPNSGLAAIPVTAAEFRGRADLQTGTATLETGRFEMAGTQASVAELRASWKTDPGLRWRASASVQQLAPLLALLPPAFRTQLPFPESSLGEVGIERAETVGTVSLAPKASGGWTAMSVAASGETTMTLGAARLSTTWEARQASPTESVAVKMTVPEFNPRPWSLRFLSGTPAAAVDFPVSLTIDASAAPDGTPRNARLAISGGAGTLHPLMPDLPGVAVRRVEARLESDDPLHSWRVPLARIELADSAVAELTGAQLDLTADRLTARAATRAAGLGGAFLSSLLPPELWEPLKAFGLTPADFSIERADMNLQAEARLVANEWVPRSLQTAATVDLRIQNTPLRIGAQARLPEAGEVVEAVVELAGFRPSQLRIALSEGVSTAALDFPLSFKVESTATLDGTLRSARIAIDGGAGTLIPTAPGIPRVSVQRLEARLESDDPLRAWRIPVARIELADNASAELLGAQVAMTADRLTARAETRASGLTGAFLSAFAPASVWEPLKPFGLAPADISVDRVDLKLESEAALVGDQWVPRAVQASGTAQVRVQGTPLQFDAEARLPQGAQAIEATLAVAEFRPSQFRIPLAEGVATSGFDFPVAVRSTARLALNGEPIAAAVQVRAGAGRLIPEPNATPVPLRSLALDASYDPKAEKATIDNLSVDTGIVRFDVRRASATLRAPHLLEGEFEMAGFALRDALQLWPSTLLPDTRKQADAALKAGSLTRFTANGAARYSPGAPAGGNPLAVTRLQGEAVFADLDASVPELPGPVAVKSVVATFDFPRASIAIREANGLGATVPEVRVQVTGLDTAKPTASVTAQFSSEIESALRLWQVALPPGAVTGRTSGVITMEGALTGESMGVKLTLDTSAARMPLPGVPNAMPSAVNLEARATDLIGETARPAIDFAVNAPGWMGEVLRTQGSIRLDENLQPIFVNVASYEHGRTSLQGRVNLSAGVPTSIALGGSRLDLSTWMRIGLKAAEEYTTQSAATAPVASTIPASASTAVRSPAASANRPATVSAPLATTVTPAASRTAVQAVAVTPPRASGTATAAAPAAAALNLDLRIDEIEFGPRQTARNFVLTGRVENDFPVKLDLSALGSSANAMRVALDGTPARQRVTISIDDSASWLRTLTAPWAVNGAGNGPLGAIVTQVTKIPAIVAGGSIQSDAELALHEPTWFQGTFKLSRATMVRPPRVLQLLALKSGRALQRDPLIEEFSIGRVAINARDVSLSNISFAGAGLINNLKVGSATYALADEAIKGDGTYFGIGFEVLGTRLKPEVFLKDTNRLLRAIGTQNEFDFDLSEPEKK